MILFIDTSDYNKATYALIGEKIIKKTFAADPSQSNKMLGNLENFFKQSKISSRNLKKIVVCKGPGSFTGVRVGLSHALALGLGWNVPVVPIAKEKVPKDLKHLSKYKKPMT